MTAATALVVVGAVFMFSGPYSPKSGDMAQANLAPNGLKLVSYETSNGVVLQWNGLVSHEFRVLKSKGVKDFSNAAVRSVEGTSWIDPNPGETGCTYYRIEKVPRKS